MRPVTPRRRRWPNNFHNSIIHICLDLHAPLFENYMLVRLGNTAVAASTRLSEIQLPFTCQMGWGGGVVTKGRSLAILENRIPAVNDICSCVFSLLT